MAERRNLQLVNSVLPQNPSSETRLTLGKYIADLVPSKTDNDPSFYYIVQQIGSADVIEIERCPTFEQAAAAAKGALQRWNSKESFGTAS
jgi:hypothetical protein